VITKDASHVEISSYIKYRDVDVIAQLIEKAIIYASEYIKQNIKLTSSTELNFYNLDHLKEFIKLFKANTCSNVLINIS
jgi:hypothetical protein